jgi:hypothetical protein
LCFLRIYRCWRSWLPFGSASFQFGWFSLVPSFDLVVNQFGSVY